MGKRERLVRPGRAAPDPGGTRGGLRLGGGMPALGSGEPFTSATLDDLLLLASVGLDRLFDAQRVVLGLKEHGDGQARSGARSSVITASASISIKYSGRTKAATCTCVLAG